MSAFLAAQLSLYPYLY